MQLPAGSFVHLSNDLEAVRTVLSPPLRSRFEDLLHSRLLSQAEQQTKGGQYVPDLADVWRAVHTLDRLNAVAEDLNELDELMRGQARVIMSFFQHLLVQLDPDKADASRLRQTLESHVVIQALFPFIRFRRNPEHRILLLTFQKAYHGFFDGHTMVNLARLHGENGDLIVFLDEFDFLEHDLLTLITESEQISDPFHFVELFYRAMTHHKLPSAIYPFAPEIRRRIEKIVCRVDALRAKGLHFPEINQFTATYPELRRAAIFQTARTVTSTPLYLHETDRSFEIVPHPSDEEGTHHLAATVLFNAIHSAANAITYLFKQIEAAEPLIYDEMVRQCFQNTTFERELRRMPQQPRQHGHQTTRFDTLLNGGYTLFEVIDLQQETDREEVDFRQYTMSTTPEKLLAGLAAHNLVFGLSATADLPRIVRHFNLDWVARQENVNLIEIDEEDRALVQALNDSKQRQRDNRISVHHAPELDAGDPHHAALQRFVKAIALDEGFGEDDRGGHRRQRVERFWAALLHLAETRPPEQRTCDTHLMFLNTFRQIRHICARYPDSADGLFVVQTLSENARFPAYEITVAGCAFNVIFYDAAYDRHRRTNPAAMTHYHGLFWQGKPVVVVTQYPSAGNGVNLQYLPGPESKTGDETDFGSIHLLEAPYFYFDRREPGQTAAEARAVTERNIWYFAKLYEAKYLSENQFRQFLGHIHAADLNSDYQSGDATREDYLLNQIATFVQALGRIERVWHPVADQTVFLCREVQQAFELYITNPYLAEMRRRRTAMTSSNLQQILAQIEEMARQEGRTGRSTRDERLDARNEQSKKAIAGLLDGLAALRAGHGDRQVRQAWQQLRRDVLRHNFESQLLRRSRCVFRSAHYTDGILWIDDHFNIYSAGTRMAGVRLWDMNLAYSRIAVEPAIRRHFERQGYELAFSHPTQAFLTPYCYQSVLLGAIGEEAVRAVLEDNHLDLEEIDDALFELADLKLSGRPWYIDCKNYHERTLERFGLPPDDPAWRPKLNEGDFRQSAMSKLSAIRNAHGPSADCKLIYLNLVGHAERPRRYFDRAFNSVDDFDDAEIIVIQGILDPAESDGRYNLGFRQFLSHLHKEDEARAR